MLSQQTRHLAASARSQCRAVQRRWAQVHDIRFLATHPQPNHVYDKYKLKLDQKAKLEGYRDVDALRSAYADKTSGSSSNVKTPRAQTASPIEAPPRPEQTTTPTDTRSTNLRSPGKSTVQTLSSFIDVEKTSQLPSKEIEQIWRLRHASNPRSLCAAMTSSIYSRMAQNAQTHPQFVLPVPREGQGAEIHFMQWTFPSETTTTVLFTHLAEYKLRGEHSTPHTTITLHRDLANSNDIVLLEGQVLPDRGVSTDDAKWLLMCLQKFYAPPTGPAEPSPRQKLLVQFSQGDTSFKIEELLDEAEKIP